MDSLAIQRSLTLLEERYRELQEIGEKRFQAWEAERADLQQQLYTRADHLAAMQASHQAELNTTKQDNDRLQSALNTTKQDSDRLQSELNTTKQDNDRLQSELNDSRQEAELLVLQLHQVQEELEHYFLKSRELEAKLNKQSEMLQWLHNQKQILIKFIRMQADIISQMQSLQARIVTPAALAFDRLGGLKWLTKLHGQSQQRQSAPKRLKAISTKKTLAVEKH